MPHFKHILFPVDFSDRCRVVQPFVISMARQFQAKVTLLHVINIPAGWYGSMEAPYPIMFDIPAMLQSGEKQLASYLDTPGPSQIERVVQHGDPATKITAFVEQHGIDLIMMPTHGYGTFRSLLLGSVTTKVLHDADCAVWTAAHTDDPTTVEHVDYRNILCAVDLVPESVGLIRYADDLARLYQAKLRLVHAAPAPEIQPIGPRDDEFRRSLLEWAGERIAELQLQVGTDLEVCLAGGGVSNLVRDAALQYSADLVVIGRGREQRSFGSLRTNAYAIIRESPCPVLRV